MNCCWILLLLLFCGGNHCDRKCGCDDKCDQRRNDDRRGRDCKEEREDSRGRQGSRPAAWPDCGCDNDSKRTSPRQDFPGFNRCETCGCENDQN
ncbi:MAG: hypothetical protein J6C84_02005 [Lachnospiraceae bacterium]|nr:hypothetical protein [Lachnospiraceae bacterium]